VQVVGLTGGIGSGKSTLAGALRAHGVEVIDADQVSRRCVEPGTPGLAAIVERFGDEMLRADGSLDRSRLAGVVFEDAAARHDLESITHPCIRAGIDADVAVLQALPDAPDLVVIEHPLLVETGGHERVDVVVVVEAPLQQRIDRLTATRGMAVAEARSRIAAQADDARRRLFADHVVINDGDLCSLRAQVPSLLERIRASGGHDEATEEGGRRAMGDGR
jgi:dephospho-CoA kinase